MLLTQLAPSDFCFLGECSQPRFSAFERLTLTGGKELDRALGWIANQLNVIPSLHSDSALDGKRFEMASQHYAKWRNNPALFFNPPAYSPKVDHIPIHGLADGEVVDLVYQSSYRPSHAAATLHSQSQTVYVRHWRHSGPARPTIVAIHGWGMGDQRLNALAFLPGYFYSLGLDVALVELPHHGRRAAAQSKSGELAFPSTDPVETNEGMGQVISDLRELRLYLESRGAPAVGVMGMSLGGYSAALWASLDALAFCVTIVPMTEMGEVAWQVIQGGAMRAKADQAGITPEMLRDIFSIHSPLSHTPKVSPHQRLIIAGLGDMVVPPKQPHMLWEHWERPNIRWFTGGHVAQFRKSKAFREIGRFLVRLGLAQDAAVQPDIDDNL